MTGALLNAAGILLGGIIAFLRPKRLSPASETVCKTTLGAFTVFYGLRLTWLSINGSFGQILKQMLIMVVSLMLGKMIGRFLGLQRMSNRVGQYARVQIARARPDDPARASIGFKLCAALFCAAPLLVLGSLQDGLSEYFYPLAIKSVMDGLATMGFVSLFGMGVVLAALPVLALEGTVTLFTLYYLKPLLEARGLVDPINAVGGMLVFCVALLILGLKKIEVTDYLPSLAVAPLIAWGVHSMG